MLHAHEYKILSVFKLCPILKNTLRNWCGDLIISNDLLLPDVYYKLLKF